MQLRDEHYVVDVASAQGVAQRRRVVVISPRHDGRHQAVSAFFGALPGSQDRGQNPFRRRCRCAVGSNFEDIVIDGYTLGVFPFDEHHADGLRCHGHAKRDVHCPSKSVCCINAVMFRASMRLMPVHQIVHRPGRLRRYQNGTGTPTVSMAHVRRLRSYNRTRGTLVG